MNLILKSKKFSLAFSVALFWAISIIITKLILRQGENPVNLIFWAILLASPFWLFVFSKNIKEFKSAPKSSYWILVGMGIIGVMLVNIVEMFAIKYSQVINYSFLIRTTTLFTIILAFLFLGEKLTWRKVLVTFFILAGAYFLTTKGQIISFSWGDTLTILEAILISFGNTILGKMATNKMSSNLSASASSVIAVLPMAIVALGARAIALPKAPLLLLCLVVSNIMITTSRFRAYKYASASYVTMIASFTPVIVSILAIPIIGESILPIQLFGGVLILLATILVGRFKI